MAHAREGRRENETARPSCEGWGAVSNGWNQEGHGAPSRQQGVP